LPDGVTAARVTLNHLVLVRIQVRQPPKSLVLRGFLSSRFPLDPEGPSSTRVGLWSRLWSKLWAAGSSEAYCKE
jgi:hypothetical protein